MSMNAPQAAMETLEERVEHLIRLRQQQDKTGGFTAFIPWTFQPSNTEMDEPEYYRHNQGVVDYLKMVAVSRLMLDNFKSIQASWVTQGLKIAEVALRFGADDFGSTMIEENVVASTGISYTVTQEDILRAIRKSGFRPAQRNTFYEIIKYH